MSPKATVNSRYPARDQSGRDATDRITDPLEAADAAETAARIAADLIIASGLAAHLADLANPHATTKAQVGLSNVPNLDTTSAVALAHARQHSITAAADHTFPGGATFLRADGVFAAAGGTGDVVGPAGATADAIALFDGVTGKLVKDSVTLLAALALLAGRAGGQTLKGGTAAAENLTLQGTANATPGKVIIASSQLAGTAQYKALAYRTTTLSVVTATSTAIGFDAEDYDVGGLHDNAVNNSRLTAPVAGYYLCFGAATFEPNGTGARASILAKNGAPVGTQCTTAAIATIQNCPFLSKVIHLNAGDYVEMLAYQDTGGNIDVGNGALRNAQPEFGMILMWSD